MLDISGAIAKNGQDIKVAAGLPGQLHTKVTHDVLQGPVLRASAIQPEAHFTNNLMKGCTPL